MAVYFALRTHYGYPTGKYLRRFPEDESVLAWFQRHWVGKSRDNEEEKGWVREILGCDVYGFATLFEAIAEHSLAPPKTMRELAVLLNEHLYAEGEIRTSRHTVQVLTDDDELELAYYFFDDHYLKKDPAKASYLLWEDWRLPEEVEPSATSPQPSLPSGVHSLPPVKKGKGTTYAVFLSFYDSGNLVDLDGTYRIVGIRLPELLSYLQDHQPADDWVSELPVLRALTVPEAGSNTASKTLAEVLDEAKTLPLPSLYEDLYRLKFGSGTPKEDRAKITKLITKIKPDELAESGKESLIQSSDHIAQLCLHCGTWEITLLFQRWIFFDDLWLLAHPDLGKAILRFGTRWDVLT